MRFQRHAAYVPFNFYHIGHCGEGEQKEILNYLPSTLKLVTKAEVEVILHIQIKIFFF